MRILNLGKVQNVPKLDEKKAIETGAQVRSAGFAHRQSRKIDWAHFQVLQSWEVSRDQGPMLKTFSVRNLRMFVLS
jgi:hypothetical protein